MQPDQWCQILNLCTDRNHQNRQTSLFVPAYSFFAAWENSTKTQGAQCNPEYNCCSEYGFCGNSEVKLAGIRSICKLQSNVFTVQEYCSCDNCINYGLVITDKVLCQTQWWQVMRLKTKSFLLKTKLADVGYSFLWTMALLLNVMAPALNFLAVQSNVHYGMIWIWNMLFRGHWGSNLSNLWGL